MEVLVGTAGWTVPKQHLASFSAPDTGLKLSHLERYATQLECVEVNSSFYRTHRRSTWERWAAMTPKSFRFAVKAPRAVTHTLKLQDAGAPLLDFFQSVGGLGSKLGVVLVQLPPKLAYDEGVAQEFFTTLRELHAGGVALEPRHASWLAAPVDQLLRSFEVARVAADPPKGGERAGRPGGWPGLRYWRLHGAPRTYYSDYEEPWLQEFAKKVSVAGERGVMAETWVVFDNTALGHATANALHLWRALRPEP